MAKILVTGASGFIGGHVARELHARHEVLGLGRAPAPSISGGWRYAPQEAAGPALDALVRRFQPDYLLHCAGNGRVDRSITHPAEDFAAGPCLTFALLDALRREAPGCVTVFMSSAAVHGAPREGLIAADTPLSPISSYGFHKQLCETVLAEFKTVYGLDSIILRVLSCYGDGLRKQILWDVCRKAVQGNVELFGTGGETRDFIHVSDLARLTGMLVDQNRREGLFPVGSGSSVSIRELAGMLLEALGLGPVPVTFKGQEHQGYPSHWLADARPLAEIGFTPAVGMREGVAGYAAWFSRLESDGRG